MAKAIVLKEPEKLERFLSRRRLDGRVVDMLKAAKDAHDLKRGEITTAQSATYSKLTEDLIKAVNQGWVGRDSVVAMLDNSEIAGRQHVCVFQLPTTGQGKILDVLRAPHTVYSGPVSIEEFYEVPSHSMARIIKDTADEVIVKIVAQRSYWTSELLKDLPDEQLIKRLRHQERSALILTCNKQAGLLQVRVQPREKAQADTAKNVNDFMMDTIKAHYDVKPKSWFYQLRFFPIADTFPKLLKNKAEFVLKYDTPEDNEIKASMFRKGDHKDGADLRDDPRWSYSSGYSRNSLRGVWKCKGGGEVYLHLNQDAIRISATTTVDVARVFVPGLCSDKDLDHAIRRIHEHL
ncbi:MAG TPA: hypothetical protein VHV55_20750 [Pirellulales bacterium]|jgi:hypothetical protein|nr:hypothetical protein [Pirellulales bacterium]